MSFAGRDDRDDVAIICRNTTEAINHLAYRLRLAKQDVVLTTVVEHHANLLPWARAASCRYVECGEDRTSMIAAVTEALEAKPAPKLLAITGASNVTGWMPPVAEVVAAAHERGVPVLVDAAQLAPHRQLPDGPTSSRGVATRCTPPSAPVCLLGPPGVHRRRPFPRRWRCCRPGRTGRCGLDRSPSAEEAGSPNVVGAVALGAAIDYLEDIGWQAITAHDSQLASALRRGLSAIAGVRLLGPGADTETLPVATFIVGGIPHSLLAARLSAEDAIGVRHGIFAPILISCGCSASGAKTSNATERRSRRGTGPKFREQCEPASA